MKKVFNLSSPLGIALTVAGVVLALSPEARKAARRALVKGTAAVLGAVDQVKEATTTTAQQTQHALGDTAGFLEAPVEAVMDAGAEAAEGMEPQ